MSTEMPGPQGTPPPEGPTPPWPGDLSAALEAARQAPLAPPPGARDRIWQRLEAGSLGAAATQATSAGSSAPAASSSGGAWTPALFGLGLAALGVVVGVWVWPEGLESPAEVPTMAVSAEVARPTGAAGTTADRAASVHEAAQVAQSEPEPELQPKQPGPPAEPVAAVELSQEDAPVAQAPAGVAEGAAAMAQEAAPVAEAAPVKDDADRASEARASARRARVAREAAREAERALLEKARRALRGGRASEALALTEEHRRHHRRGRLVEEREAIAVRALVAVGRDDAALRRGSSFRTRYPSSIHRAAVDRALSRLEGRVGAP